MKSLRDIAASTKPLKPREASIVAGCLKYLNALPSSKFQKRFGGRTRSGDPDITGCFWGNHWEIEVKTPGNKPTERQYAALQKWAESGAIVCWVTSLSELREIVAMAGGEYHPVPFADVRKYAHNLV